MKKLILILLIIILVILVGTFPLKLLGCCFIGYLMALIGLQKCLISSVGMA